MGVAVGTRLIKTMFIMDEKDEIYFMIPWTERLYRIE